VCFFANDSFKDSTKGEVADLTHGNEVIFTLWAESKEEVDTPSCCSATASVISS
jgi:predicted lactoylglutathione lyase